MADWIEACAADDIDEEDVIGFDHDRRGFAIKSARLIPAMVCAAPSPATCRAAATCSDPA